MAGFDDWLLLHYAALSSRVVRNGEDANAGNDQTYYASIGDNIIIYCYCRNVQR